jgi:SAM-dependent methyltransferase
MANEQERKRWNTPEFAASWPRRGETITTRTTAPLLELLALRAGERVLDIGCGGGLLAIEAARTVGPGGSVAGFDISEPLTQLATTRAEEAGLGNVTFTAGDAQVDAIAGGPFDAIESQFGVMFFADPTAAFKNIRRHLKVGARLAFACWQPAARNLWFQGLALAKYMPPPPPTTHGGPPPGPFAFGDVAYVRSILEPAGFGSVACRPESFDAPMPDDNPYQRDMVTALGLDEATTEKAWQELQALGETFRAADGKLHITLNPQFITATAT